MKEINKYVLIVAGGSGSRMNTAVPKQFIRINNKPLLLHTFKAFFDYDPTCTFILVLPKHEINYWEQLCKEFSFNIPHTIVEGGITRFHSVRNGLDQINDDGIVFIHDGVRPLVSIQTITNCFQGTLKNGNALPVITPSESVRKATNGKTKAVERRKYFLVQTPQTFKVKQIKEAYNQQYNELFTDDASVLENLNININLVEGNRENIKITYPEDLKIASIFLSQL